jgi:hypothetical protein
MKIDLVCFVFVSFPRVRVFRVSIDKGLPSVISL